MGPPRQRDEIFRWLLGLAQGMAELVKNGVVPSALRMERSPYETFFLDDYSLWDAYVDLRRGGQRDEFLFFVRLALKLPLLQEVTARIEERFLGCEGLSPPHEEGRPLLLCAIADWISISFPSHPDWNHSRLAVRFLELGPDAHLEETREEIDTLDSPPCKRINQATPTTDDCWQRSPAYGIARQYFPTLVRSRVMKTSDAQKGRFR